MDEGKDLEDARRKMQDAGYRMSRLQRKVKVTNKQRQKAKDADAGGRIRALKARRMITQGEAP